MDLLKMLHEGAKQLTEIIRTRSEQIIGQQKLIERKTTHPWINKRVEEAIAQRNAAEGTDLEKATTEKCSEVMLQERERHIAKTRLSLQEMKEGSNKYWSTSNELLGKESKVQRLVGEVRELAVLPPPRPVPQ